MASLAPADKRFLEKIRSKTLKAIHEFHLIQSGDRIAVAISGGKDSMALLDILHNRQKIPGLSYHLTAIHVDLTQVPYHAGEKLLENFTSERQIPFFRISSDVQVIRQGKQPCFYCAWNRRKLLFQWAADHGYTKIALGHHADDVVETLMMNMIYHGETSAITPLQEMFGGKLQIIRPLYFLTAKELERYISLIGYTPPPYDCPYAGTNHRERFRELLSAVKKLHPHATGNILRALRNLNPRYLPPPETE